MIGSVWGLLVVGAILASSAMALMWLDPGADPRREPRRRRVGGAHRVLRDRCTRSWPTATSAPRARGRARVDLGIPPRRLPPRQPRPRQGRGRPLPGAPRGAGRRTRTGTSSSSSRRRRCSSSSSRCRSRSSRSSPRAASARSHGSGIAVWAIGNVGTIVSDCQLARWRENPANKGAHERARAIRVLNFYDAEAIEREVVTRLSA